MGNVYRLNFTPWTLKRGFFLHLHVEFRGQLAGVSVFHLLTILCAFKAGMEADLKALGEKKKKKPIKCVHSSYCEGCQTCF